MTLEAYVEVRRVTRRFANGQVRATEHVGFRWVPVDVQPEDEDEVWCAPSAHQMPEGRASGIRHR